MKRTVIMMCMVLLLGSAARASIDAQAAAYYKYGAVYHKHGDFKKALAYYNAAVKKERKLWQAWLGLGICYYEMKRYRNAALIFRYVKQIKPGEKNAQKYLELIDPSIADKRMAEENKKRPKKKSELLWRSAIVPGWGQFYNDDLVKAYLFSLSYMASLSAIIKYTLDQQAAADAYANTNYDFENTYREAEEAALKVWIPAGTAAVVWMVSVIDAWMSGVDVPEGAQRAFNRIEMIDENTVAVKLAELEF
ncbi:MAG: tetratricopeptide repeat protein [Candidatus Goldiibacteriota bacterium]